MLLNTNVSSLNTENKEKTRCKSCNGCGLVKRKKRFKCNNCLDIRYRCYTCENANIGFFVECDKCYGDGYILT